MVGGAQPAHVFDLASMVLKEVNQNNLFFRENVGSTHFITSTGPDSFHFTSFFCSPSPSAICFCHVCLGFPDKNGLDQRGWNVLDTVTAWRDVIVCLSISQFWKVLQLKQKRKFTGLFLPKPKFPQNYFIASPFSPHRIPNTILWNKSVPIEHQL